MPKTKWEVSLHALGLCLSLGLPLLLQTKPDYAALAAVCLVALGLWFATVRSDDPFLSTGRVTLLGSLVYANAAAYSLSSTPALPVLSWEAGVVVCAYLATLVLVVSRAAGRVADIDLEYFRYSLPSKRLKVDMGRRTGRLDQAQASLRLQLFVKEGLQFRRLSRVCRLLVMQGWAGLAAFVVFGFHEPWHLLAFMGTTLMISASATSIASRATLHPGQTLDNDWVDSDQEDDGEDEEEDPGEYRPRRR
jgi:hypothetical protein